MTDQPDPPPTCPVCGAAKRTDESGRPYVAFQCGAVCVPPFDGPPRFNPACPAAVATVAALREWKGGVLGAVKTIPEYTSGKWAGDKEGWGFVFELIRWQIREVAALRARVAELVEGLRPFAEVARGVPDSWPGQCVLDFREQDDGQYISYLKADPAGRNPTIDSYRKALALLGERGGDGK